jgi:CubicO group peptidase (beta-lactamase class C family)
MKQSLAVRTLVVCLLLLTMSGTVLFAPSANADSQLEARISRVERGLLGPTVIKGEKAVPMQLVDRLKFYKASAISIAVINNGKIEWSRAYGVLETGATTRVNSDTKFQAASISKTVSALIALRLVEQSAVVLDQDVNAQLVSWKIPETDLMETERPTLRRLLTHTAGVTVSAFLGYKEGQPLPTVRQILDGERPANSAPIRVDVAPGGKFRYSGGGYMVVQQLLTDVTKLSFPQLAELAVFRKLGMKQSSFAPQSRSAANIASGHLPDGSPIDGKWFESPELAAAGLWTTPSDLARVVVELQKSKLGKSNQILSQRLTELMLTPQTENAGFGVFVDGQGRSARFSFSGSNVGYKSYLIGYLNSGQGVVVMTNSEIAGPLLMEVIRSVAAEYNWPDYRPTEKL